jgi:hypothetical protein
MSHPLDGCWAKIDRANENIEKLRSEIVAFARSDDYRIGRDVNHEIREYTFRAFGPERPVPLRFSVLAVRSSTTFDQASTIWFGRSFSRIIRRPISGYSFPFAPVRRNL